MRVLVINGANLLGGAGKAAFRLYQALKGSGVDADFISPELQIIKGTEKKSSGFDNKILSTLRKRFDQLPVILSDKSKPMGFSTGLGPRQLSPTIDFNEYDILHFHWINGGYLPLSQIKTLKQPIVWTLHDMWPYTGGCHYDNECERYTVGCGQCPMLQTPQAADLSKQIFERKKQIYSNLNLHVIGLSQWMKDCAERSNIFEKNKISLLPNCLDVEKYQPYNKEQIRKELGIALDKKVILYGAINSDIDKRKGFETLHTMFSKLNKKDHNDLLFVSFGNQNPEAFNKFNLQFMSLGTIKDEQKLAHIYAAADIFLCPSKQDNLPNTIVESIACGTPVVAYKIGGIPDIITHKKTGYLAPKGDIEAFKDGIMWILETDERLNEMSQNARTKAVEVYNPRDIATRYIELYQNNLEESK